MPESREASPTASTSSVPSDISKPVIITVVSTSLLLLSIQFLHYNYFRRIRTVDALPQLTGKGLRLKGYVTSVGDADNFRLYHLPRFSLRKRVIPTSRADLKDQTLHIRLAGVDAPELAHFGNPAQPHSTEALAWLTKKVINRHVQVQLFSKDRYGRVVGMAYVRPFPYIFRQNVSEEMLKVGYATVYRQAGAVHAGLLTRFEALESTAKAKGVGMWSKTSIPYESPAEYKRRMGGNGAIK